jgi:hypothetical protein
MTLTIAQEFSLALVEDRAEQDSFKPLIAKFEELKEVLQSNFKMRRKVSKWYGKTTYTVDPAINLEIEDKITHSSGKYLFITINGCGCVMGLGEIGELKDRLYFIEQPYFPGSNMKNNTCVYIRSGLFGTYDYCLENKITNVQLFSGLIKKYKQFLLENKITNVQLFSELDKKYKQFLVVK